MEKEAWKREDQEGGDCLSLEGVQGGTLKSQGRDQGFLFRVDGFNYFICLYSSIFLWDS